MSLSFPKPSDSALPTVLEQQLVSESFVQEEVILKIFNYDHRH